MELKTYLFLPQGNLKKSYIAVKQAYISCEIANKTERVGDYGVLFTTEKTFNEVVEKLKMKKDEIYLLIDITGNIASKSISGFMPNTDIKEIGDINLKINADLLKLELDSAIANEDFERAIEIREKLKNK